MLQIFNYKKFLNWLLISDIILFSIHYLILCISVNSTQSGTDNLSLFKSSEIQIAY